MTRIYKNKEEILYPDLSYKIVGLAMEVHNKLGPGFLEKVYENAMMVLFRKEQIPAQQQVPTPVYFEGELVGDYIADIMVDNKIILELKSVANMTDVHTAQVLNYLKATGLRLAILLNFGKEKLQYDRAVF
jgi:GxxExxY protein